MRKWMKRTILKKMYSSLNSMILETIKEETDMAVLKRILSFFVSILLLVAKLLCLAVRLVLGLFLLVVQMVLVIFHAGSSL